MSQARNQRDELFARLVALWARGGMAAVGLDGRRCSRAEAEAEIIRALRPLCRQVAQEPADPPGKARKPKPTEEESTDASTSNPEADPA